jgi:hypothetical protein
MLFDQMAALKVQYEGDHERVNKILQGAGLKQTAEINSNASESQQKDSFI